MSKPMDSRNRFTFVDIILDKYKSVFQSGEEVCGHIKFALNKAPIVTNIKTLLVCVSEVEWVEDPDTIFHRAGHVYQDKIRQINQSLNKIDDQTYALPKKYEYHSGGEHKVPFTFKLPEKGIPSSFTGPYGSIRYYIEVISEEAGLEDSGERIGLYEFRVEAPFREELRLSIGCSKEKDFGVLSLGSGKIMLHAGFSKKGWVPGERLELHTTVDNQSTVEAAPRATLYQTQIYKCGERHRGVEIPIGDPIVGKKVAAEEKFAVTLLIPTPKEMSLTIKSALISVKYFVHVTLDIPHASDIHVNVPIVMTNEPVVMSLSRGSFISSG